MLQNTATTPRVVALLVLGVVAVLGVMPYRITAATPAPGGYALRLEGRLTTFADGKAVKCVQRDRESRPVCVAALRLDRLAFEDGATGALLSEWRPR